MGTYSVKGFYSLNKQIHILQNQAKTHCKINCLLVRYSYMSYLCVFDYRINPNNNISIPFLSVDAIVLYLKDLQGRPKYAQFYAKIFISKTTLKSISSWFHAKLYHQNTKWKEYFVKGARAPSGTRARRHSSFSLCGAVHFVGVFAGSFPANIHSSSTKTLYLWIISVVLTSSLHLWFLPPVL